MRLVMARWGQGAWRPVPTRTGLGALSLRASAAVALTCLLACSTPDPPQSPAVQPSLGGGLRILHEHVQDLDPRKVDDIYESTVSNQIYEGLVRYDSALGIAPQLALSWIISPDGLRYTFQLRQGVRFHDGSPLDADDVIASLTRTLGDRRGECLAETYLLQIRGARDFHEGRARSVAGLRGLGPDRVEIELEEPLSFFLAVLAMDQTRIVPVERGAALDTHPIGTGPFVFVERRTATGLEELVLVRHEEYWGERAYLDSLTFVSHGNPNADESARIGFLLSGAVDGVAIRASSSARLRDLGYRVTTAPELTVSFLGMQTQIPPLDDPRVRRAIAHCVDREALSGPDGTAVLPAAGVLPPGLPGYHPSSRVLPYDLQAAARLVGEAGYGPDHPAPELVLYTSGTGRAYEWIDGDLRETLASIGLPLEVRTMSWVDLDRQVTAGRAPLFLLGWLADVPDADGFLHALFHSTASNNLFGFADPRIDRDLAEARRMQPGQARLDLYQEIEGRILEAAPIVPLYHELTSYAWRSDVAGVALGPYGLPSVRFSRVWRTAVPPSSGVLAGDER